MSADPSINPTMPMPRHANRIRAAALRRALIAGARRVQADRENLNRINVFPVPDGDTGSNLAFTLTHVLDGALSRPARHAGSLLTEVAKDALDGARGNSGAILAQFLYALGEHAGQRATLSAAQLAAAVSHAAKQARAAMLEPREGTMLSVIQAFADALQTPAASLTFGFEAALQRARQALTDTPNQLAVLRQAGVVDAGAQGFVDLLDGIATFLRFGRAQVPRQDRAAECAHHPHDSTPAHGHVVIGAERWCSECMIENHAGSGLDREALRDAVAAVGATSVVLAGGAERMRVHAHVKDPGHWFATMAKLGRVSQRKADDMLAQQRAMQSDAAVAVMTDSAADLPAAWIERSGLFVVPVRLNFAYEDFLDKVTLHPAEFYVRLRNANERPQTSQPAPGDIRRMMAFLGSHHEAVVYVGISRPLSGTLQAAESVKARLVGVAVDIVDSGHASCGEGLLALAAAEAARDGADATTVVATVERLRRQTFTFAATRDLSYAVRGGRIPRWAGPLARWLPLTPIAGIDANGLLKVAGCLPGSHAVPQRLAAWIVRRLPAGRHWRVLVGHGDCAEDGAMLRDALVERLSDRGKAKVEAGLVEAGPAIGSHAGLGALVVGVQRMG